MVQITKSDLLQNDLMPLRHAFSVLPVKHALVEPKLAQAINPVTCIGKVMLRQQPLGSATGLLAAGSAAASRDQGMGNKIAIASNGWGFMIFSEVY